MKISVYKCDNTGKLFEDKNKYIKHLKKLATSKRIRRDLEIKEQEAKIWWENAQNIEMDLLDLKDFIIENQSRFWADAARVNTMDWNEVGKLTRKGVILPVPKLVDFTKFSLNWSENCSNTHSAPRNGFQNWLRSPELPTGYPGWLGHVEWAVEWPYEFRGMYLGGDLFDSKDCRIHTGGGGGGGYHGGLQRFGYSIQLFESDWPGLARFAEKKKVWNILKNKG
jgi:hypothetical protein